MRKRPRTLRPIRLIDGLIDLLLLTVALVLLALGVYARWDGHRLVRTAQSEVYAVFKPSAQEHLTFDQLSARNPEVIGWLALDDTSIDYPLVQGEDNAKYVNTAVTGEFSLAGSIFLDCRNSGTFADTASILYGHHIEGDVMFGGLDHFAEQSYFDAHRSGTLFFDGESHPLHVFALVEADGYDTTLFNPLVTAEERADYLARLRAAAVIYDGDFDAALPLLLLSTCVPNTANGRILLATTVGAPPKTESQQAAAHLGARGIPAWVPPLAALALLVLFSAALVIRRAAAQKSGAPEPTPGPDTPPNRPPSLGREVLLLLLKLAGIAAFLALLFTLVFGLYVNADDAMAPAAREGDLVFCYRLDRQPGVRELVLYRDSTGETRLGRVVARAGDTVDVTADGLRINGFLQREDYAVGETLAFVDGVTYPVALEDGEYFVLGDNRAESADSRLTGPVDERQIIGRVIAVFRWRDF